MKKRRKEKQSKLAKKSAKRSAKEMFFNWHIIEILLTLSTLAVNATEIIRFFPDLDPLYTRALWMLLKITTLAFLIFRIVSSPSTHLLYRILGVILSVSLLASLLADASKVQQEGVSFFLIDGSRHNIQYLHSYAASLEEYAPNDNKREVALAVFGASQESHASCSDYIEIIPPSSLEQDFQKLPQAINNITRMGSHGRNSLQNAIMQSLQSLSGHPGVHQIYVINGPIVNECSHLDRNLLDLYAIKMDVKFELIFVQLSKLDSKDVAIVSEYANRIIFPSQISGSNLHVIIQSIVKSPPFYYSDYGFGSSVISP